MWFQVARLANYANNASIINQLGHYEVELFVLCLSSQNVATIPRKGRDVKLLISLHVEDVYIGH